VSEPEQAAKPEGRIAAQLNDVRRRGVDDLELAEGNQGRINAADLERLAADYCQAKRLKPYGRRAQITRLLQDAIAVYAERGNQADAELVRGLFFNADSTATRNAREASALLKTVTGQLGLTSDAFAVKRRRVFDEFAGFLADFVAEAKSKRPATKRLTLVAAVVLVVLLGGGTALWLSHDSSSMHTTNGGSQSPSQSTSAASSAVQVTATGKTYTETSGNGKGTRVFSDPARAHLREIAPIPFMQRVQVSCRAYVPAIMQSVTWWYRLASPPYNDQWWSPAVTFLNGDDPNGPYNHDVDESVPACQ
jgi:hypothetical protein